MADLKVGDEVVCVDSSGSAIELVTGAVYLVERIVLAGEIFPTSDGPAWNAAGDSVWVSGPGAFAFSSQRGAEPWPGYGPQRFTKRRDLTAWLATAVKVPALDKRKVRA